MNPYFNASVFRMTDSCKCQVFNRLHSDDFYRHRKYWVWILWGGVNFSSYPQEHDSGGSKNFEKGGGGRQFISPSSFIANAHSDLWAFYTEKAAFWKKNWANRGEGRPPHRPLWIRHWNKTPFLTSEYCNRTTSISVHEPSVFQPSQEFATPYDLLFVTASHSAAFRRHLKTRCFQSAFTAPRWPSHKRCPDSYQKLARYKSFTYIET